MTPSPAPRFVSRETAERLLEKAAPLPDWNLSVEQFRVALERSAAQRFRAGANAKALEAFFEALHLGDLALACACSAGNAAAWGHFVAQYRPELYRAARAIAGESARASWPTPSMASCSGCANRKGKENLSSIISMAAAS